MNKLSHQQYVINSKKKIVRICERVFANELSILEAAREITALRFEAELDENDENILTLVGIDSETDHLPIGNKERDLWNVEALKQKDKEIKEYEKWARDFGTEACKNIVLTLGI